jgi:hypothetical protein
MAATLDGRVEATGAVFEAKFMLPWAFSEEAAAEKYMPQLQHNMWVVASRSAVLSVITGGGKWVEIITHADPLYQHLIVTGIERRIQPMSWSRSYPQSGPPRSGASVVRPPKRRGGSLLSTQRQNFRSARDTRQSFLDHERAKTELKSLMPEDAKEAIGHGVRAKRSKSGAVSFDLLVPEGGHAAI